MAEKNTQIEPKATTELNDANKAPEESLIKPEEVTGQALGTPTDDEVEAQLAYEALKRKKNAKKRKRIIIILAVLIILTGGFIVFSAAGGSRNPMEEAIHAAFSQPVIVRKGKFQATVGGSGKSQPISESVVSPEVQGIIENLSATVGQQVQAGDVLFTIKNDDLDTDVRKKQEALETAQRARDSSYRKVEEAWIARENAWNRANNAQDWSGYDENALMATIHDAEDAVTTNEANVVTAQQDLDQARAHAEKRTVVAPVSGSIVAVNARNGQSVGGAAGGTTGNNNANNGPLIQIADTSQMKVTVQINEVDIEHIEVGEPATVTFQALPDVSLEATVQNIATVASSTGSSDSNQNTAGIVTYAVDLTIPNDDGKIKPGMTASVTIVTQEIKKTIVIPSSSIFGEDAGSPHVLKITDAEKFRYDSVPVEIVAQSATESAVKAELSDGDALLAQDIEMMQTPGAGEDE